MYPFSADRLDYGFASVVACILNLFRGKGKPTIDPMDLTPDWGRLRKWEKKRKQQRQRRRRVNQVRAGEVRGLIDGFRNWVVRLGGEVKEK